MRGRVGGELGQLAEKWGVKTAFTDAAGREVRASRETVLAALRALGVPIHHEREAGGFLRERERTDWERTVEPVLVAWDGFLYVVRLRLTARASALPVTCTFELEDGTYRRRQFTAGECSDCTSVTIDGRSYVEREIHVRQRLPIGYHTLRLETRDGIATSRILSAPLQMYRPKEPQRDWGLFAPVYALRRDTTWRPGTYTELADLTRWMAQKGGRVIGTLPLLPAFLSEPYDPSPYSPVTRLFWNEFYADYEATEEFQQCRAAKELVRSRAFRERVENAEEGRLTRYREVMEVRRSVMEVLADHFFTHESPGRTAFEQFRRENPRLDEYASFRAVREARKGSWREWPEPMCRGRLNNAGAPEAREFYLYAQWAAHQQMTRLRDVTRKEGVKLYLDMPLGVHPEGYDCWRYQDLFAMKAAGGAPPDLVFTKGQNWGFAPLHPGRLREEGYDYIIQYLRHHLQHAGMLRIDHVIGLHHLYWVPEGLQGSQGAYIRYRADELYAVLAIESQRHSAVIVGENLGTVAPEVNESMERHGMRSLFVVEYELQPDLANPIREAPAQSVASLATHDMPPFQAFWEMRDLADRQDLGLMRAPEVAEERKRRTQMNEAFVRLLQEKGLLRRSKKASAREVLSASLAYLGGSAAEVALVTLEDLWLETESQNTPGTSEERENWKRQFKFSLKEIKKSQPVDAELKRIWKSRLETQSS